MVEVWSPAKRFAFRFGVLALVLFATEHSFVFMPSRTLGFAIVRGWHALATWFGALLGIDVPPLEFTGSGDQLWMYLQFALVLILAAVAALVWTLRARALAYPRLAATSIIVMRYLLASILIGYGMAKVVPMQFPPVFYARYDQPIGDMSPMGLLWTFMGHPQAYTWIAGFAEVLGSVLLLWRRTYVIGALLLIGVMTNVVLLNLCYDVPVKLFSMQLLVMLVVLVLPDARRLIGALLGHPTNGVLPRTRGTPSSERIRLAFKLVALALIALRAYEHWEVGGMIRGWLQKTELHGIWRADRVVIDGVERPPLLTDDQRWHKVIVHELGVVVRYSTDRRQWFGAEVDPKAHTITLVQGRVRRVVWTYQRVDAEHLIIDAPHVHAELVLEPPPRLPTRGFHWIQEAPYNR